MGSKLPWANCRLVLEDEHDDDSDLPPGVVARLYLTEQSHPGVKQSFQALRARCEGALPLRALPLLGRGRALPLDALSSPCRRKLSLAALAVQSLVNRKGEPPSC